MTHNENQKDLLERAIADLRSEAAPSGPSDQVIADTLNALRQKPTNFWQRTLAMTFTQKLAAAIAVTLGGMAICFVFSVFSGLASVGYAQVADAIRSVRSMSCNVTVTVPGVPQPITSRMSFLELGRTRQEFAGGVVTINDRSAHRSLSLQPQTKTAVIIELATNAPATRPQEQDVIESFKKLADQSGEDAGERQIGDIKAKAFRVRQVGSNAIVLVDPRTHLPIRVEFEVAGGRTKAVMENFNFDAKLDPSLFSLDPPAGYTVEHQNLSVNVDPLENMVWVLKAYAEKKQGQFPPHLDDLTEIFQTLSSSTTQPVPSRDQLMQMSAHGAAVTAILFSYEKGKTYDYLPDQARLGERDRIVFWYQPTKRGNYKAIFGDLHVAEVTADQLPKSPTK